MVLLVLSKSITKTVGRQWCALTVRARATVSAERLHSDDLLSRPKVLVTHRGIPEAGIKLLKTECEVIEIPGPVPSSYEDIVKQAKGVDAILWASVHKLDSGVISAAGPGLRAVSCFGAGYDHIDAARLRAQGVRVGNTRGVLSSAVAEMAIAMLLSTARRLQEARRAVDEGSWKDIYAPSLFGRDVAGSTIGIVGLGGIGQAFAKRISAFSISRLIYTGHKPKAEGKTLGAEFVSFDELVSVSDFILLACPFTAETENMFDEKVFKKMKSTAIFLNISRGGCVDQDALVRALQTNEIKGAGLDVMTPEPLPTDHPLLFLPNCVLFPHIGAATKETHEVMAILAAKNILCALKGQTMPSPIP